MGLDTLDEFSPKDSDPISLGDDAIRETRSAVKASVGVEHFLDGPHKIPSNTTANRPAAGRAGRVRFNSDSKSVEYDDGTAWQGYTTRKAAATCLWHSSAYNIASGATVEIPFDYIIDDPGGYASVANHQIIQPANSMGIVSSYLEFTTGIGGYGSIITIQQFDGTAWRNLVSGYSPNVQFMTVNTMVDSRWGTPLRVVVVNGSPNTLTVSPTAVGASPRFAYAMLGRTA